MGRVFRKISGGGSGSDKGGLEVGRVTSDNLLGRRHSWSDNVTSDKCHAL